MRNVAWVLLLVFAFAIPWEYSLDLGAPLGNVARVAGLLMLLAAVLSVLQAGRIRNPGPLLWLVLALFLWFCCTCFWTIDTGATLVKLRGYFQELMIAWLVWEFVESPRDLRLLMNVFVAGCWVLALLTLFEFRSAEAIAAGQIRFAAYGQDPNDVARYLCYGFPLAALLGSGGAVRWHRWLTSAYLPVALFAVLLTASRGGLLTAAVALAGSALLLVRGRARPVLTAIFVLPVLGVAVWALIPAQTLARLATIPYQLGSGDLNQRLNIWWAGWQAFRRDPVLGSGAGTYVQAAGLSQIDTAHNTALSLAVGSGLVGLSIFAALVLCAALAALRTQSVLRLALASVLAAWLVASTIGTVEENRTTWLLLGLMATAGRLAVACPEWLQACFPEPRMREAQPAAQLAEAG